MPRKQPLTHEPEQRLRKALYKAQKAAAIDNEFPSRDFEDQQKLIEALNMLCAEIEKSGDTRSGQLETFMNHKDAAEKGTCYKMDSENQISSKNAQANFCNDSPSPSTNSVNLLTSLVENLRIQSKWNPIFDENFFDICVLWFKVKQEHQQLLIKDECTASELVKRSELKNAIKGKCDEFMKLSERKELIGEGTYGEVRIMKLDGQTPLFIQKISKAMMDPTSTQMEAMVLGAAYTPYIPKLIYSGYTIDGKWCTIMEYFTGGTLDFHIDEEIKINEAKKKLRITAAHKKYIAYQLALAIEYLHLLHVTHGDLKPNNIVLTKDGHVRLIDFGLASNLYDEKLKVLPRQVAVFSSPEVWNKKPAGLASDWWSYGVIIAYLYQLQPPFRGNTEEEIQMKAQTGEPSLDDMPHKKINKAKIFIRKLLVVDPDKRLTNVSSNHFFNKITETPFRPGNIEAPEVTPSGKAEYVADDPIVHGILEATAIWIPSSGFFETDYYKSIK